MADDKDKAWIEVQKKAFTHWVNTTLEARHKSITNSIEVDLADGVLVIDFVELLIGNTIKTKWTKAPSNRINKIENSSIALRFLKEHGVEERMLTISAEELVDGNLKLILGFCWMLFRKFRIMTMKGSEGSNSAEDALLNWVRTETEGYKGVRIENFGTSFNDGLAFLALVHKFDPNLFDYDSTSTSQPSLKNAEQAIEYAEKHLGVPKLIEAKDLVDGKVDTRAIVLYTSLFLHAFRATEEKRKLAEAANASKTKVTGLESELQSALSEKESLEKKFKDLTADHDSLKVKLQESEEKTGKLQSEKEELEREAEELRMKFNRFKQKYDEREKTDLMGLDLLLKNIPEHIVNVNELQGFLELEPSKSIPKFTFPEDWNGRLDQLNKAVVSENADLDKAVKNAEGGKAAKEAALFKGDLKEKKAADVKLDLSVTKSSPRGDETKQTPRSETESKKTPRAADEKKTPRGDDKKATTPRDKKK